MAKQYIDPQPRPPEYKDSLQKTHVPSVGSQYIPIGGSDPQFSLPVGDGNWLKGRDVSKYDLQPILGSIRYDHLNGSSRNWIPKAREMMTKSVAGKIDMFDTVSKYDTHTRIGADTWVPKYSSYQVGVNNEERLSKLQSSTEKFFNPIVRTPIKVLGGGALDLLSLPYGIIEGAITGRLESVYDNDFANWIDSVDARVDHRYRNYYSEAEKNLGFNTYTWDKTLGGAEFTGRMLVSEAILASLTGGTSVAASLARSGLKGASALARGAGKVSKMATGVGKIADKVGDIAKTANILNKAEDVVSVGKNAAQTLKIATEPIRNIASKGGAITTTAEFTQAVDKAGRMGKFGKALTDMRFAMTSSAYEAGFEARHYKNEAEREFWEYHRINGTEPTQEELHNFYDKLDTTSWTVYGTNMALLGASNVAMFGKMFNIGNPFPKLKIGSYIDKNLFKLGTQKGANGVWEAMKPGAIRKALGYGTQIGRGFAIEGVFEEGMQGVVSGMASNYIKATYDPEYAKTTADWASAFTKAFHDQYSSKEGLEEVIIGGITGGLFGIGGAVNLAKQYKNQETVAKVQNAIEGYAKDLSSNLYTNTHLSAMMAHNNRLQYLAEASNKGVGSKMLNQSMDAMQTFVSMLEASHKVGKGDFFMETLKSSITGMDAQSIADNYGIDINSVEDFKADKIKGMEKIAESYHKARETAEYLFGQGNISGVSKVAEEMGIPVTPGLQGQMIDTFAYIATMADMSQQYAKDSYNAVQSKLADMNIPEELRDQYKGLAGIQAMSEKTKEEFDKLSEEVEKVKQEKEKILTEIEDLQEGDRTPEKTKRLAEIAKELQEKEVKLETLRQKKDLLWKSSTSNFFNEAEGSTGRNFENYEEFNKAVDELVDDILTNDNISEEDRRELLELMSAFNEGNSLYKSFANLSKNITDPKFSYKTFTGLFSKVRANKLDVNETTKEAYKELLNDYARAFETVGIINDEYVKENTEVISNEDVENMEKEDFQPTPEQLEQLAEKVKNNKTLGHNEQLFYNKFKNEVDEIVNKKVTAEEDPINDEEGAEEVIDYTPKITKMQQELDDLEAGEFSPYVEEIINNMPDDSTNEEIDNVVERRKKYLRDKLERYENGNVDSNIENNITNLENLKDTLATTPREDDVNRDYLQNKVDELEEKVKKDLDKLNIYPSESDFKSRIDWINRNLDKLGISEYVEDVTKVEKPTPEEMSQYMNLKNKNIEDMSAEEKEEFATLRNKVRAYKLIENSNFGDIPLLDMLDAVADVKKTESIRGGQGKVEEEDLQLGVEKSDTEINNLGYSERSPEVGLIYDGVFVSRNQLHHVRLSTLAHKAVQKGMTVTVRTFTGTKAENNIQYSEEVIIPANKINLLNKYEGVNGVEVTFSNESGKIVVSRPNTSATRGLHIEEGDVIELMDARAYSIKGANINYLQIYDKKSNGTYGPMEADFVVSNNGVKMSFDTNAAINLEDGQEVYVKFEANDDYNKTISKREYASKGNMYIVDKNGKLLNILKAGTTDRKNLGKGSSWSKLKAVRKLATQKPLVPVRVVHTFLGYPKLQIDENNKPIKHKIVESKVLSYGYKDANGAVITFKEGIEVDNNQYVTAIGEGKTIPVVIFKYGNKNVAFPIEVKSEYRDVSGEVTEVLSNKDLNEAQKVLQLNTIMSKYGIENDSLMRRGADISTADVAEIKEQLSNIEMPVDYKDPAAVKRANKSIFIDMNDPFMASKIILDYGNVEELVEQKKENKEAKKETPAKEGKEEAEKKTCKKKKK